MTVDIKSTSEQACAVLRERIRTGVVAPGTPLREAALSASLGVSRNTLREAFCQLATEGLLHRHANRGVTVAAPSVADVIDVFTVRRTLESAGLRAIDQASNDRRLRGLRRAARQLEDDASRSDWAAFAESEARFHTGLVEALESRRLADLHARVMQELRLVFIGIDREADDVRPPAQIVEHQHLVRLLERGRSAQAQTLLQNHLAAAERLVLQFLETQRTHA